MSRLYCIVLMMTVAVLSSCVDDTKKTDITEQSADSVITATKELLDTNIINRMVEYYLKEYKHDSWAKERTDSTWELTLSGKYRPDDKEEHFLLIAYLPVFTGDGIKGDIDGDGVPEMIFQVTQEGGGGGGNVWWNDIFVFSLKNNKYELVTGEGHPDLCQGVYFYVDSVENGRLKGRAQGYAEHDGRCCPSLNYETYLVLKNGKLVCAEQTRLPDTPME